MDPWQSASSWITFAVVGGSLAYYYWPSQKSAPTGRRQSVQETPAKSSKRTDRSGTEKDGSAGTKKRKAPKKEQPQSQPQQTPAVVVDQAEREEKEDMSNRKFAEQMAKARKGANLTAPKSKEGRIKTVKQGSAVGTPVLSSEGSQTGADGDDDMSPAASPAFNAGDVSDMLEPAAKGPSTLRLTSPSQPQKERAPRQKKEEAVETKKQRQNRMKKEQERLERQTQEQERKKMEEKTRRAAREARGEPAKNGIPVSKPPANNAWTEPKPAAAPAANGNGPLLDTFDADSTASSNGGPEPSTAATSTNGHLSEEEQMATAMKQSEDESGWSVAAPKKQQKKKAVNGDVTGNSTPVEATAPKKCVY